MADTGLVFGVGACPALSLLHPAAGTLLVTDGARPTRRVEVPSNCSVSDFKTATTINTIVEYLVGICVGAILMRCGQVLIHHRACLFSASGSLANLCGDMF
jgi:hypothetical protein